MEWLEGGASGSAGQRDVEANVSGLNLHMRRNERWMDGWMDHVLATINFNTCGIKLYKD